MTAVPAVKAFKRVASDKYDVPHKPKFMLFRRDTLEYRVTSSSPVENVYASNTAILQ